MAKKETAIVSPHGIPFKAVMVYRNHVHCYKCKAVSEGIAYLDKYKNAFCKSCCFSKNKEGGIFGTK